jgi:GNAT superfamily N-acetyltransferase
MVGLPAFEEALARKVSRGQALCVREADGDPGAPLLGGLLWSSHPPHYQIGWLAVTAQARRQGLGRALVAVALAWAKPPASVEVVTFGDDTLAGRPARQLYLKLGFAPAEMAPLGPEGGSRQVFRLCL